MNSDAQTKATADAERLLAEFAPNADEAQFVRDQGDAIFAALRQEFLARAGNGSMQMRPMTLEMAIAYASFAAAEWARAAEHEAGKNQGGDPKETAQVEAEIRYLTPEEGGRHTPVASGYRGQFHYDDDPDIGYDGFQYFPDVPDEQFVPLGTPVKAVVRFFPDRWRDFHSKRMSVGTAFQIREGRKVVGRGVVTKIREP